MTPFRVMKVHEFDDSVYYRIACDCGEPACDLQCDFTFEKDTQVISLYMFKNLKASAHWGIWTGWMMNFDFIRVWWRKFKMCCSIIFKGYIEVCEETRLRGGEHIENFIEALQIGNEYIMGKEEEWQEFLKLRNIDPKDLPGVKSVKS